MMLKRLRTVVFIGVVYCLNRLKLKFRTKLSGRGKSASDRNLPFMCPASLTFLQFDH